MGPRGTDRKIAVVLFRDEDQRDCPAGTRLGKKDLKEDRKIKKTCGKKKDGMV